MILGLAAEKETADSSSDASRILSRNDKPVAGEENRETGAVIFSRLKRRERQIPASAGEPQTAKSATCLRQAGFGMTN